MNAAKGNGSGVEDVGSGEEEPETGAILGKP